MEGGYVQFKNPTHGSDLINELILLMNSEVYMDIMLYCKDGRMAHNRLTLGLVFPQLSDEMSVICPDYNIQDIDDMIHEIINYVAKDDNVDNIESNLAQKQRLFYSGASDVANGSTTDKEVEMDPLDQLCHDLAPFTKSSKDVSSHVIDCEISLNVADLKSSNEEEEKLFLLKKFRKLSPQTSIYATNNSSIELQPVKTGTQNINNILASLRQTVNVTNYDTEVSNDDIVKDILYTVIDNVVNIVSIHKDYDFLTECKSKPSNLVYSTLGTFEEGAEHDNHSDVEISTVEPDSIEHVTPTTSKSNSHAFTQGGHGNHSMISYERPLIMGHSDANIGQNNWRCKSFNKQKPMLPFLGRNLRATKKARCGSCSACKMKDCLLCIFCKDMKKYGGKGKKKQSCIERPKCQQKNNSKNNAFKSPKQFQRRKVKEWFFLNKNYKKSGNNHHFFQSVSNDNGNTSINESNILKSIDDALTLNTSEDNSIESPSNIQLVREILNDIIDNMQMMIVKEDLSRQRQTGTVLFSTLSSSVDKPEKDNLSSKREIYNISLDHLEGIPLVPPEFISSLSIWNIDIDTSQRCKSHSQVDIERHQLNPSEWQQVNNILNERKIKEIKNLNFRRRLKKKYSSSKKVLKKKYSSSKKVRCGKCKSCTSEDCRQCIFCKDMKKYGGKGIKKQSCIDRRKCELYLNNYKKEDIFGNKLSDNSISISNKDSTNIGRRSILQCFKKNGGVKKEEQNGLTFDIPKKEFFSSTIKRKQIDLEKESKHKIPRKALRVNFDIKDKAINIKDHSQENPETKSSKVEEVYTAITKMKVGRPTKVPKEAYIETELKIEDKPKRKAGRPPRFVTEPTEEDEPEMNRKAGRPPRFVTEPKEEEAKVETEFEIEEQPKRKAGRPPRFVTEQTEEDKPEMKRKAGRPPRFVTEQTEEDKPEIKRKAGRPLRFVTEPTEEEKPEIKRKAGRPTKLKNVSSIDIQNSTGIIHCESDNLAQRKPGRPPKVRIDNQNVFKDNDVKPDNIIKDRKSIISSLSREELLFGFQL